MAAKVKIRGFKNEMPPLFLELLMILLKPTGQ